MNYMYYRNLVDVIFTEDEAKKEAEEVCKTMQRVDKIVFLYGCLNPSADSRV